MKSRIHFFIVLNDRRARAQARRLARLQRAYESDPEDNFNLRSEAANLAQSVSYHVRQTELAGRRVLGSR